MGPLRREAPLLVTLDGEENQGYHDYSTARNLARWAVESGVARDAQVWLLRPGDEPLDLYSFSREPSRFDEWQRPDLEQVLALYDREPVLVAPRPLLRPSALAERRGGA